MQQPFVAALAAALVVSLSACADGVAPHPGTVGAGGAAADVAVVAAADDADEPDDPADHRFSDDDVRFSFVVIGCNRVDKADTAAARPSTANVAELNRAYAEIAQMRPLPRFVFFAGDMVFGYAQSGTDTLALMRELPAWMAIWQASPAAAAGVEMVPLEGNHEMQTKAKIAYPAAERVWLREMGPYITHAGNGPGAGGPDNLATDQSRLTYSFDYGRTHFVLVNTDPYGKDGSAPVQWIREDLAAAQSNHAKHIFVISHKPAYAYPIGLYSPALTAEDGLGGTYPAERDALWAAFADAHVEAMLSAHNHLYYRTQGWTGATWQVIAGNGGTPIEPLISPYKEQQSYFGYSVVTVHRNNRVTLTAYAHHIGASYLSGSPENPTFVGEQADLTWPQPGNRYGTN
jgi:hypothetical protein